MTEMRRKSSESKGGYQTSHKGLPPLGKLNQGGVEKVAGDISRGAVRCAPESSEPREPSFQKKHSSLTPIGITAVANLHLPSEMCQGFDFDPLGNCVVVEMDVASPHRRICCQCACGVG